MRIALLILAIVAGFFVLVSGVLGYVFFVANGCRRKNTAVPKPPQQSQDPIWLQLSLSAENAAALPQEELSIRSRDGLLLRGTYFPAKRNKNGRIAFLVHGYRGNGLENMAMFLPFYHKEGFDVFIPDNRAHGKSEGRYIGFGYLDRLDCIDWCRELLTRYGAERSIVLHGISMGGATVDMASGDPELPKNIAGVISDCALSSCVEEFTHVLKAKTALPAKSILRLVNIWCRLLAHYDLRDANATEFVRRSSLPFLFIHGARDTFVPTAMVNTLYDACKDPGKEKWIVPDAKHFVSYLVDKDGYERHLTAFFDRIGI